MVNYKLTSPNGKPLTAKLPNSATGLKAERRPNVRCPHCMHMGSLTLALPNDLQVSHNIRQPNGGILNAGSTAVGIRICPNDECLGIIFVAIDQANGRAYSFPPEVLDFDPTAIPDRIAASLGEAIKCHSAGCYKASALMVRRVLEELCEDKAAKGNNLKERLASLSQLIVVPKELLDAADHLRLLGNDAAHIEAKTYDKIDDDEVRIAIDLAKELLKSAYQYADLLGRLKALQKP